MYNNKITKDFIENNHNIIKNLYDDFRIVDPLRKKVLFNNDGTIVESELSCFNALNRNKICDNCISIRAFNNKSTFTKIENIGGKIYLITSIPLEVEDETIIVELIKEVTNSFYYEDNFNKEDYRINNLIENMKKIANEDPLTEIYNRRFVDERLPIDMYGCINNNEPISIIMADVDYYKDINDRYGHLTGDYVLKKIAKYFKMCIRINKDWIARYGGDEFLVCIPGADEKLALEVAERMHNRINNEELHYKDKKIKVTVSFGICTISDNYTTMEEFIHRADEKLYEAKASGRNKIVY